jgi:hypothetical protein
MKKLSYFLKNILLTLLCSPLGAVGAYAHIGSSGVIYEGKAGNYNVQIFITPPDVIPGTATVSVMVDGLDVQKVLLKPIYYWTGEDGTPRADEALPVKNETGKFEGVIWLMQSGAAAVKIEIEGSRGKGSTLVPIAAVATAKRNLPPSLGWILGGLGLLLIGLMTTIIGASNSDSLLKPGEKISQKVMRKRIVGSVFGVCFCGLSLFGGNAWWKSEAGSYDKDMYRSFTANSKVSFKNGERILNLTIDSASVNGRSLSYVIPDHGKLMHLFLVRQGTMDAFAHLHPLRKDTLNFEAKLPNLPAGKYLLYADMLRYHGFQYTIADTVEIPQISSKIAPPSGAGGADSDDTYVITNPLNSQKPLLADEIITICGTPGVKTPLQDGSSIVWEEKPNQALQAGKVYDLKFSVLSPEGKSAELQPYLGMMGHAAVLKDDGSVYIHLHPNGTFSTTSVQAMQNRLLVETSSKIKGKSSRNRMSDNSAKPTLQSAKVFRDSVDNVLAKIQGMNVAEKDSFLMAGMKHDKGHHAGNVNFPYSFPSAGNYRIWLQIKRNGRILTGVFDAKVI